MRQAVVEGKVAFEKGFSGKLSDKIKPLLECGETHYKKRARGDDDIQNPKKKVYEVDPFLRANTGYTVAFINGHRYIASPNTNAKTPGLCDSGRIGLTTQREDLITFCKSFFDLADKTLPVHDDVGTVINKHINDFAGDSKTGTMVHEFAHYFGTQGTLLPENPIDQSGLDKGAFHQWPWAQLPTIC